MRRTSPPMDPRIKAALAALEGVDPELRDLVAGSDSELADLASVNLMSEQIEMPDARPLAAAERQALETEILLEKMGIGEIDAPPDPPNWLRARGICSESVASNGEIAANVLAIAKIAAHDPAAASYLAKRAQLEATNSGVGSRFVRNLAAHAEEFDPDSTLTRFLKSFEKSDSAGMRAAVREALAAEA
jgi:hypothetical protein